MAVFLEREKEHHADTKPPQTWYGDPASRPAPLRPARDANHRTRRALLAPAPGVLQPKRACANSRALNDCKSSSFSPTPTK